MKKNGCLIILSTLFFISCSMDENRGVEGLWQLKTITENGIDLPVDTIFYSFQLKQEGFAYTIVHESWNTPEQTKVFYGYVGFPSKNQLHIQMDSETEEFWSKIYKEELIWRDTQVTYDILKLNCKEMILKQTGQEVQCKFIKF